MRGHARKQQQFLVELVLLLLLYYLQATGAAKISELRVKCTWSVPRCFTQTQQEQLCGAVRSDSRVQEDPTSPGQCAKLALGGRSLQATKFASRVELLRAASIVELCAGARHTGPAKCWLAIPSQVRYQMLATSTASPGTELDVESEAASLPLVQTCRHAQTDSPGKCLLLWLTASRSLSKQDSQDALVIAIDLCRNFDGQTSALGQCVKQTTPLLRVGTKPEIDVFKLCQFVGDGANLPGIVECATKLGRKRVFPSLIAQLCARASDSGDYLHNTRPQTCFLEAQTRLRWMDLKAQVALCQNAITQFAIAPVECAFDMKNHARTLFSSSSLLSTGISLDIFIADVCNRAISASIVVDCVRILPVNAFSPDQAVRLCGASAMPTEQIDEENNSYYYPTTCASQARSLLQRSIAFDTNIGAGISASAAAVRVCEHATSNAPSQCLADTQFDRALSVGIRIELCQRARSDAPQRCVNALRKHINTQRLGILDAVLACSQTESLGPVDCLTKLLQAPTMVKSETAAQLCQAAKDVEPARCFLESPRSYGDSLKVTLCNQAVSTAPALCADTVLTRLGNDPLKKVNLCRGASTIAPARCVVEAPFGMDTTSLIMLCQNAPNISPANCAQALSPALGVPWYRVAQVCAGAESTIPGRCLAYHVRHALFRALDDNRVVRKCRQAIARPSSLEIAKAAYNCPELRPRCSLQLVLNILDQYGDFMMEEYQHHHRSGDAVYVSAVYTERSDQQREYIRRQQPNLQGPSYAMIVNGSAIFSALFFTAAGEYVLTFRAREGVTEEVARVVVHPDHDAEALEMRCEALFARFQCSSHRPSSRAQDHQDHELQTMLLPQALHLSAISCEQYWLDRVGGLIFRSLLPPSHLLYTLPRPLYDLFTNTDMPRADMSAYELLGLREGETSRAAIRRAYHRKSLEWHPDKWHSLAAVLPLVWQQELSGIYSLVTQAYDQLVRTTSAS